MTRSFKLFSVRGIDIRLHITFPLILLWAAFQFWTLSGSLTGALFGVVAISILFALVTLHELGHSFAARYYGVDVERIVLSPIGGVAQLARMPEKPIQELVVAIAGPAVNVALAVIMGLAAVGLGLNIINPLAVLTGAAGFSLAALFSYIFFYNIFLGAFNMIPAFPMDGGRVLRAVLAMRLNYVRATNIAAGIGQALAILFGLFGLLNGSFFQIFIAIFIYMAATQESAMVRLRGTLRGYTVSQAYSRQTYRLSPDYTLQQATNLAVYGGQNSFPVVDGDSDLLVGFLPQDRLMEALRTHGPYTLVRDVMRRDIAPLSPATDLFDAQQRLGSERMEALPVAENGRFLGLITWSSIQKLQQLMRAAPQTLPGAQSA